MRPGDEVMGSCVAVALAFVERINRHDVEGILELMTEDHLFFDSLGNELRGREALLRAWTGYLEMVPDYAILAEDSIASGQIVVIFGTASGTYAGDGRIVPENRWQAPAAWKAVIRDGMVAEWRVYTDNEPLRAIIRRGVGAE